MHYQIIIEVALVIVDRLKEEAWVWLEISCLIIVWPNSPVKLFLLEKIETSSASLLQKYNLAND